MRPRNEAEAPSRGLPVLAYFSSTASARSSACAVVSIIRSGRMPSTDLVRSNDERDTRQRMPVDITPSTEASGMIVAGIDEAGDAVLEQFGGGERGGEFDVLGVERGLVRIHAVEQERLGVGLVGEPARELERRMQVAVDVARRRHGVAAVDGAAGRILRGEIGGLADGDDLAGVDGDRRVADDAAAGIDGDQPADIGDEEINRLHAFHSDLNSTSTRRSGGGDGRLPLPLGEGWGEGLRSLARARPPHPNPLPRGERERTAVAACSLTAATTSTSRRRRHR